MRYYILKRNPADMGCVPQAEIVQPYNFNLLNSIRYAHNKGLLDILSVPQHIDFKHHAKPTDLLSSATISGPYLLISPALMEIFKKHRMPGYYAYPVKISKRTKVFDYFIYIQNYRFIEFIKLDTCNAFIATRRENWREGPDILEPIRLNSVDDFNRLNERLPSNQYLVIKNYELNTDKIELDLFLLAYQIQKAVGYVVSEKLKEAIEAENMTGIAFEEFPDERHKVV
jgi:hypothetical protein